MEILFKIKDIEFTKEDFLDDISEYDDIIPIIKAILHRLMQGIFKFKFKKRRNTT